MDFTRSDTHCSGEQDQQVNTVTAFLDGSVIYGTSEERAMKLRGEKREKTASLLATPTYLTFSRGKVLKNILMGKS